MFDYQTLTFRTLFILIVVSLAAACAETGTDDTFGAGKNQASQNYQSPDIHPKVPENHVDFDDSMVDIGPDNIVPIANNLEARQLFESGIARFEYAQPFQQVSWMMVADDASKLEFRFRDSAGTWSDWQPIEITWKEKDHYNMLIRLEQPVNTLEMRGGEYIRAAELEFYPIVKARDNINFDLADEVAGPSLLDDVAEQNDNELRSIQQLATIPTAPPDSMIVTRKQWGARNPDKVCGSAVAPYRMAIHHTSVPSDDGSDPAIRMRSMQNYHIDTQKWCDIGYHFVISQSGKIYQGASRANHPGAHVGGQNSGNVGISFIADFTTQTPTTTQLNAGAKIIRWVHDTYGVPLNRTAILGHREHAGASTSCPGNNMMSRLQHLIDLAKGNPVNPQPVTYKTDVKAKFISLENFYTQGTSAQIADVMVGQKFQTEILVHNQSASPIRNVQLSYFIESPYLSATNYVIQTDHPQKDQKTWVVNDANDAPANPAKNALGKSGTLTMHAFGAGETKRVLIDLKADRYSIGLADHPDVRGWISNIDDVYKQAGWNDAPSLNKLTGSTKSYAQLDILSPNEWQFASTTDAESLEGWTGRGDFDKLSQNINAAMLAQHVTGKDSGIVSPAWTHVDADTFDQLVFHARAHDGEHTKAIYWARKGESFSEDQVVRFKAKGDGVTHPYVVPMSEHPKWNGVITQLRIDQLDDRAPSAEGSAWYDLAGVYFQSSTDKKTSSNVSEFESIAPVKLITKNNDIDNPAPDVDTPDKPGTTDPDDSKVPGGDLDNDKKDGGVGINSGCSTISLTTNTGNPISALLLFGLGMFALSFIRRRF